MKSFDFSFPTKKKPKMIKLSKMKVVIPLHVLLCALFNFTWTVDALKCRTAQEVQENADFEYVVRMCLRHLRNDSDINFNFHRNQYNYDSLNNKRHREDGSSSNKNSDNIRNYYGRNQNKEYTEGFDRFWSSNKQQNDRNRYWTDEDRNRQPVDYNEESDYYGSSKKNGRKKSGSKFQTPHSYQQQLQHDRDMIYGHTSRDSTNYFNTNHNKNKKIMFSKNKNNDSPLADIDPCVIHCIFQEMQMVDDNGKPNKILISQKMTQRIRNSELKNFIQDSVEECVDAIEDDIFFGYNSNSNNNNNNNNSNSNSRRRKPETMCEWAKTFAMCLEDRGRENCDDWNEPVQSNSSSSK